MCKKTNTKKSSVESESNKNSGQEQFRVWTKKQIPLTCLELKTENYGKFFL